MNIDKLLIELKNANIQILRNQLFALNSLELPNASDKDRILLAKDTEAILLRLLECDL